MRCCRKLCAVALSCALLAGCVGAAPAPGKTGIWLGVTACVQAVQAQLAPQQTGTAEVERMLKTAIEALEQPPPMRVDAQALGPDPAMAVKNLYFGLTADHPALKYAYDVNATVENGLLTCRISYMPYKTGQFPAGFTGQTVSSLGELVAVAEAGLGQETVPIRITNPALLPEDLSRALDQASGGEVVCSLNRDATAIVYSPTYGRTMEQCLQRLEASKELARQRVAQLVIPGMGQREAAQVLYDSLTETVVYDRRYNTAPETLPHAARTAYGALHDKLAICGGYALAYQQLLQEAGIACYTVSGSAGGEYHMWTIAQLDGQWRYFDPTWDRGCKRFGYRYSGVGGASLPRHQWDASYIARLVGTTQEELS